MSRRGVSGWMFLLVPAHPGSPGQRAVKRSCVCVLYVCVILGCRKFVGGCFGHQSGVACAVFFSQQKLSALIAVVFPGVHIRNTSLADRLPDLPFTERRHSPRYKRR